MNLKYYLRGLGIGIMVTAVIMSVAADNKKQELSDAEIKARAAQLGMVEESTGLLSDLETEKARKVNRFIGFETVIMGILGLVTIFLPPVFSALWIVLLIPYAIAAVVYGIKVGKGK